MPTPLQYPTVSDARNMRLSQMLFYDDDPASPTYGSWIAVCSTAGIPIAFPPAMVVTREDGQLSLAVDTELHLDATTLVIDNIATAVYRNPLPADHADGDVVMPLTDIKGHLQACLEDTTHTIINPATEDTLSTIQTDIGAMSGMIDTKLSSVSNAITGTPPNSSNLYALYLLLSSIDGKTPSLGQATMANSVPVAIASDQTPVPITNDGVSTATNTSVLVGTSSTTVLAANSNRKFAVITNDSNRDIYLSLGAAATMNSGIRLNANGGSFMIDLMNLFTGAIYAICSDNNKRLTVCEG